MNGSGKGARTAKMTKIWPHYAPMDTIMLEVAPHYGLQCITVLPQLKEKASLILSLNTDS